MQVITQWPGRAAEEVEQQVTIPDRNPDERHSAPGSICVRRRLFGLSGVNLIFDDDSENDWNRQKVLERLSQVTLPANVTAKIGPDYSPVGRFIATRCTAPTPPTT